MKNTLGTTIIFLAVAASAFADIRPPVPVGTATPAPAATPAPEMEAYVGIQVSRNYKEGTIIIGKEMIEQINAATMPKTAHASLLGGFSMQTIVGGLFLSLAFVFGGVWLARSREPIPTPAIGILLLALLGLGTTIVIGNVAPPKRIGLTADIMSEKMEGRVKASGKMKLILANYSTGDDVTIIIPGRAGGGGEDE